MDLRRPQQQRLDVHALIQMRPKARNQVLNPARDTGSDGDGHGGGEMKRAMSSMLKRDGWTTHLLALHLNVLSHY